MKSNFQIIFCLVLFCVITVQAQLAVTVLPLKIVGQKAVVPLAITNNFAEKVESARALCFLLDQQGKIVGQSAKWVVGGTKNHPVLEPKTGTMFNFVITCSQSFTTTNLTAKVSFSRLILDGGKLANVAKDVNVTAAPQH